MIVLDIHFKFDKELNFLPTWSQVNKCRAYVLKRTQQTQRDGPTFIQAAAGAVLQTRL